MKNKKASDFVILDQSNAVGHGIPMLENMHYINGVFSGLEREREVI